MWPYITRRLIAFVPTLVLTSLLVFTLIRVVPGDVAEARLSGGGELPVDPGEVARLRSELGLDRPVYNQYLDWLRDLAQLDFGTSLWTGRPVAEHLQQWFPVTLELAVFALIIAAIGGIGLGVLSGITRGSVVDYLARFVSVIGVAAPTFWVGTLVLLALLRLTDWAPPVRYTGPRQDLVTNLTIMFWPAVVSGFASMAYVSRLSRSAFLELSRQDFSRTARAKGASERIVNLRHILPNMLPAVITMLGVEFAHLITGVAIVEIIFSVPGLGRGLLRGIANRDYVLVQSIIMLIAFMVLVINLMVDVVAARLDPRVRLS
ncbi:MAG: ABC transporter permease [Dehalococcoidia bacterium]